MDFKEFVRNNKDKIYQNAKNNTLYNNEGIAMIASNDPWLKEDIWDKQYEELRRDAARNTRGRSVVS